MLPEYIYNIWSCGLCPALVRGGRFFDGKDLRRVYDLSDTESMPDRLERICAMRRARDRDIAFLELLRQLVKAVSVCDDWLIPENINAILNQFELMENFDIIWFNNKLLGGMNWWANDIKAVFQGQFLKKSFKEDKTYFFLFER